MGVHTALDSNRFLGSRLSDPDLEKIDLVLLDLKSFDAQLHYRLTGQDVAPVHEFARRLAAAKRPVWVRLVLVPGVTDNPDDIARNAAFAASLGNVERVDVLPFHQIGSFKWKRPKFDYKLEGVEPPPEAVERTCAQFRAAGLKLPTKRRWFKPSGAGTTAVMPPMPSNRSPSRPGMHMTVR